MATTTNTLSAIRLQAEVALYGQPTFTSIHTATASALSATVTAPNANQQVRMFHLTLSYSAAPAVSVLTVKDDTTVIWQAEISATGPFVYTFDFSAKPLRSSTGKALSANVGSAGGAVVQTLSWTGDYVKGA
jgi:hypothetical protein